MSVPVLSPPARIDLPESPCPYRGLAPFSERDTDYFFGRTAEREIIVANLIASPLTLLYAASGVGKSSVLRAGVVPDLVEAARESAHAGYGPEYIPVIVRDWRQDPLEQVSRALVEAVEAVLGEAAVAEPVDARSLKDEIAEWARRTGATMLLIFDQFEEFLLYHGERWASGEPAPALAASLSARDQSASFLLALREDALAGLDRFKGRVPGLFDNYLRLRQLSERDARTAITGPLERWNERHPDDEVQLDDELAETVLCQVGAGRLALSGAGQGRPEATGDDGGIESPFLQLVMTRVWEKEREAQSGSMRVETLKDLGGARKIVATYLDDRMGLLSEAERDVAADVFHQLVTPSGAKVARSLPDLAEYTGASEQALGDVLGKLSQGDEWRILRPERERDGSVSYEIFHDVLAEPVLDWRARREAIRAGREAVATTRRRIRKLVVSAALVALVVTIVGTLGVLYVLKARDQRRDSQAATKRADADAIVSSARLVLGSDPELSVLLAMKALHLEPNDQDGASALRAALGANHSLGLPLGYGKTDYPGVAVSADGSLVASTDKRTLRVWSIPGPVPLYTLPIVDASLALSPKGDRIAVRGKAGEIVINARSGQRLVTLRGAQRVRSVSWSPNGDRLAGRVASRPVVWSARTGRVVARAPSSAGEVEWAGARRLVAVAPRRMQLLELGRRTPVKTLRVGEYSWERVSADGSMAIIADIGDSFNDHVIIWSLDTGRTHRMSLDAIGYPLALDRRGNRALMTDFEGHVRVWNPRARAVIASLNGHQGPPISGWLSRNGAIAVTTSQDRTARVWDTRTGQQLALLSGHQSAVIEAVVSESGVAATADATGGLRLWRLWQPPGSRFAVRDPQLRRARLSRNGRILVAAGYLGLWAWDAQPGASRAPRRLARNLSIRKLALSSDGHAVIAVPQHFARDTRNRRARVLRTTDGKQIGAVGSKSPHDIVTSAAFSPDGRLIVTAQRDGAAWLWSPTDHRPLRELAAVRPPSRENVFDAEFSADSRLVATGGASRYVRVFDARTGAQVNVYELPKRASAAFVGDPSDEGVNAVALQPHGTLVAAGDSDGVVRLWDRKDPAKRRAIAVGSSVNSLAFSHDGTILATATGGDAGPAFRPVFSQAAPGEAALWDVRTGQRLAGLMPGASRVSDIAFTIDGQRIVLVVDGEVRLTDCELCASTERLRKLASKQVRRTLTGSERAIFLPKGAR